MLPTVDFLGLNLTRLIIGANPFAGFSHQNGARDQEMGAYYTVDRIKETWARAEKAGINTMVTNNTTTHVLQALREYLADGGALQWIGQLNHKTYDNDMCKAIDVAADIGACAAYIHGALVDDLYTANDADTLRAWLDHGRSRGIHMGVAAHAPEAHLWVDSLGIANFHAVCFYNCGSLHNGQGDKFRLADMFPAVEAIRKIDKPCIGYKIMAAGRIDPIMGFEFAFESIKPGDVVNVGMYRGDKDDMVEENVATVERILGQA